ncbi:hypothetical protein GCM10009834_51200 [Streptomonospora arabica]
MVEEVCEMHAHDRGFTDAFMTAFPDAMDFAGDRERALRSIAELARRAKDAGLLRRDFVLDDLVLVLMANRGVHAASAAGRVAASRRFAALAIEAFRASPDHAPLPPATRLAPAPPRA